MLRNREELNGSGKVPQMRARGTKKGSDRTLSAPDDRSKDWGPKGRVILEAAKNIHLGFAHLPGTVSSPLFLSLSLSDLSRLPLTRTPTHV